MLCSHHVSHPPPGAGPPLPQKCKESRTKISNVFRLVHILVKFGGRYIALIRSGFSTSAL